MKTNISLDNTAIAFAYKSGKELKKAHFLFSMMGKPSIVKLGTKFTPWAIKAGLPIKGLIRGTIFQQFVGGETLEQTIPVAAKLGKYHVDVILDYGVEGKQGEENYDHACDEFIRVINFAATQPNIPFMSIKVTGMARFELLEKLNVLMGKVEGVSLIDKYNKAWAQLTADENNEWHRVHERMKRISETAKQKNIGFLVDAEESWIQDTIDAITMLMMDTYNKRKPIIYNTIQLYRKDRLEFLQKSYEASEQRNFILGVKIVRGAYMEKERGRATENNYPSPINENKEATDGEYNEALEYAIERLSKIALIVATHNEESNLLAIQYLEKYGWELNHPHIHFSQLYGMSDNITFNLAQAGCSVSKYLPFGPIKDVIPYLMRRAQENTSVGGQTSRELNLINKEIKRRRS
jgi:proline dehydrogenase